MFKGITLRGQSGEILLGWRPAAVLGPWALSKTRVVVDKASGPTLLPSVEGWVLTATLGPRIDRFQLRQRGLRFSAPRKGGFWSWPVQQITVGERTIRASLGPPEY